MSRKLGPWASRIQHLGQDHGNAMHAGGRVLLLWQRVQGPIRTLWIGDTHLHAFHCEYMGCILGGERIAHQTVFLHLQVPYSSIRRCPSSSSARCCHRLHDLASLSAIQESRGACDDSSQPTTSTGPDGWSSQCRILRWSRFEGQRQTSWTGRRRRDQGRRLCDQGIQEWTGGLCTQVSRKTAIYKGRLHGKA
jgi:hypothetical protein